MQHAKCKPRLILLFLLACLAVSESQSLFGQVASPFRISWKRDAPLSIGTTGLMVGGQLYQRTLPALTNSELLALNRADVARFDRVATFAWRPTAARWSDVGLLAGLAAPIGFLAAKRPRQDWTSYLLLWWQAFSLTEGLTTWTKSISLRPRPFTYLYAAAPMDAPAEVATAVLAPDARFAFFSGHTSMTAVSTFFLARSFAAYYPDSPAKPWIWAAAAVLPAAVGIWRVRAGKHYPTDVITGYLVGATVGWTIPQIHLRQ